MENLRFSSYSEVDGEIFLTLEEAETGKQFEFTIPEFIENFYQLAAKMNAADGFRLGYFACEYAFRQEPRECFNL